MERGRVHTLIAEFADPTASVPVSDEAAFTDLGIDSLNLIDLLVALERRLGVQVPDEALPGIATVGDLLDHIENH